VTNP
jgi:hypothetical protein